LITTWFFSFSLVALKKLQLGFSMLSLVALKKLQLGFSHFSLKFKVYENS